MRGGTEWLRATWATWVVGRAHACECGITSLTDYRRCRAAWRSLLRRAYQALQRFTVLDLSNFYLDVAKDRLYINDANATDRRACQTVLAALLEGMLPLIAPLLPHMAEDAWQNLPYDGKQQSGE